MVRTGVRIGTEAATDCSTVGDSLTKTGCATAETTRNGTDATFWTVAATLGSKHTPFSHCAFDTLAKPKTNTKASVIFITEIKTFKRVNYLETD